MFSFCFFWMADPINPQGEATREAAADTKMKLVLPQIMANWNICLLSTSRLPSCETSSLVFFCRAGFILGDRICFDRWRLLNAAEKWVTRQVFAVCFQFPLVTSGKSPFSSRRGEMAVPRRRLMHLMCNSNKGVWRMFSTKIERSFVLSFRSYSLYLELDNSC